MKSIKEKRGITLIALAVTIVVILILAGVTIDVTLGENGILNKSKEAADRMNNLVKEDEAELNELLNELNETMDSNWNSNIEIPEGNNEGGGENTETDEENIGDLVELCTKVLSDKPLFFLINSYTTGISSMVLENILRLAINKKGRLSCGEIGLPMTNSNLILPCGIYARYEGE